MGNSWTEWKRLRSIPKNFSPHGRNQNLRQIWTLTDHSRYWWRKLETVSLIFPKKIGSSKKSRFWVLEICYQLDFESSWLGPEKNFRPKSFWFCSNLLNFNSHNPFTSFWYPFLIENWKICRGGLHIPPFPVLNRVKLLMFQPNPMFGKAL